VRSDALSARIWKSFQERSKILSFLRPASIERPQHDPSKYDLVVLGAPVRDHSVSNAVRAYLRHLGPKIPRLAVLSIGENIDALHLSRQIHALSGRAPVAEITFEESARALHTEAVKCERFVEAVRRVLALRTPRVCQAG
jgi:hypothetical protein